MVWNRWLNVVYRIVRLVYRYSPTEYSNREYSPAAALMRPKTLKLWFHLILLCQIKSMQCTVPLRGGSPLTPGTGAGVS